MKNQNVNQQLIAQLVKSNASEYLVWEISVTNSRRKKFYCKTATKTLSLLFMLKNKTGIDINHGSIRHLKAIIAKRQKVMSEQSTSALEAQES